MSFAAAFDGSEGATRALERAAADARAAEEPLVVIIVSDAALVGVLPSLGSQATWATPDVSAEPPVPEGILAEARRLAPDADIVHAAGEPAMTIVDLAQSRGASKLYVGAHHHRWYDALTGGDTVKAMEHRAGRLELVVVE